MAWLRIDDGFTGNGKIAQLTDSEFRCWMRLLCYCAKARDPTVDRATINEVAGLDLRRLKRLISLELLDPVGDAHEVHDWSKFLPKDETAAERQSRWRARKRRAEAVTPTVTPTVTDNAPATVTEAVTKSSPRVRAHTRVPVPYPSPVTTTTPPTHLSNEGPEPEGGQAFEQKLELSTVLRDMPPANEYGEDDPATRAEDEIPF